MTMILSYVAVGAVDPAIRRRIEEESTALAVVREWWSEPITFFFDPDCEEQLEGNTQFVSRHVDPADADFMMWRDVEFIVRCLRRWSITHGIVWALSCLRPIGRIERGEPDAKLSAFLDGLRKSGGAKGGRVDEARAQALFVLHSYR